MFAARRIRWFFILSALIMTAGRSVAFDPSQEPDGGIDNSPSIASSRSLSLKSETRFGAFEIEAKAGRHRTTEAWDIAALESPYFKAFEDNTATSVRADFTSLSGRLSLASAVAFSADQGHVSHWKGGQYSFLGKDSRDGFAIWQKFDARLVDEAQIKWSLNGEWSQVDEGYAANDAARPGGLLTIAGRHSAVGSKLDWAGFSASFLTDAIQNTRMNRVLTRVRAGIDGIEAEIYGKTVARRSGSDLAWRNETRREGIALDVMPGLLTPEWTEMLGEALPQLVSLRLERGEHVEFGDAPGAEDLNGLEFLSSWTSSWGQTNLFYWRETLGRTVPGLGFAGSDDTIAELTHTLTRGDWKFGFGLSYYEFSAAHTGAPFEDAGLSGSLSLAYAPDDGPALKISLGRHSDDFEFADESLSQRSHRLSVSASADFSQYAREWLDRDDARLTIEYRARLEEAAGAGRETFNDAGHAFLVSLSTPF